MSQTQVEAYKDASQISSDPCGVLDRDNRNHRKKRQAINDVTAAKRGDRVLEVGCGDGIHAATWSKRFDLIAIDLSRSLCSETRSQAPEATVKQADATALPLADDSVTAVVGNAVLHHILDPCEALNEWCRVATESVTVTEPNLLFPKDALETLAIAEERQKTMMAPWRIRKTVASVAAEHDGDWHVEPLIYTPPWPAAANEVYDVIDAAATRIPGLRWGSMMLRLHIDL
jgi:ubiquinone/menaquinone biosynthesis C-methylase UbiE